MSSRLSTISERLPNRIQKMKELHPLSRSALLNSLFGEKYAKIRDECFDVMINNPNIFKHADTEDSSFNQERKIAAVATLAYHRLRPLEEKDYLKDIHEISIATHAAYSFDAGFSVKCDISYFLYAKSIYSFASNNPVQQQIGKKGLSFEEIGCFGLTEMGHGSNVRGITTEAIYDEKTSQFIINSPTKESMKFWIGAAAQLATKSVIWAQLIVKGEKYGPHPFIVPLRDKETHEPFKGVLIGDCGYKNGNNMIDNGFMMFDNYRIPKDYALDRISGVDKNGKFVAKLEDPEKRFGLYMGPLSVGRAFVAINSIGSATSALAIAIRYANMRKQFSKNPSSQQQALMNYPLTKFRLMPLLATNLIYYYGGSQLLYTYNKNMKNLLDTKNKIMQELHAQTGPCKAKSSWFTNKCIGQCREVCGGHGYSSFSSLNRLYHGQDINTTWQGDNNMLLQQTTKYILKIYQKLGKGKTFENNSLTFLMDSFDIPESPTKQYLEDLKSIENILKRRVQEYTQECVGLMMEMNAEKKNSMDIWNETQPFEGNSLALSFGDLYYFEVILKKMNEMQDKKWKQILQKCIKLWVYNFLQEEKWGNHKTRLILQQMIRELCEWLEPISVSLIECIAPPSQVIGSPFSDENGDGMKKYLNLVMGGKKTFQRIPWFEKLIALRQNNKK